MAAQDAGEPFFSSNNRAGYDFYSFYIQIWKLGRVENAVLGKYKVSAGMGLVLSNAFSLGKVAALQNLGRTTAVLRPHSSRSTATYFQGAAATVRLSQAVTTTAFVSYRPFDATLTSDGDARTLITSGYHRTPLEMSKKNNTHAAAAGMRLNGDFKRLHAGLNVVYTHLDRRLQPDTKVLYRRHYASGTDFLNV